MDTIERVEKAKEVYSECLDALRKIQELNNELRADFAKLGSNASNDHKIAIGALTDANRNLDVVLLSLQSVINHLKPN